MDYEEGIRLDELLANQQEILKRQELMLRKLAPELFKKEQPKQ